MGEMVVKRYNWGEIDYRNAAEKIYDTPMLRHTHG